VLRSTAALAAEGRKPGEAPKVSGGPYNILFILTVPAAFDATRIGLIVAASAAA
jgi:hypothetical protein